MNKFFLISLWYVINGLAVAPPKIGCIIGVSTSIKFILVNYSRMNWSIFERVINVLWFSGLQIKSKYLFLYLVSLLVSPPPRSDGSMCKHGVRIWP